MAFWTTRRAMTRTSMLWVILVIGGAAVWVANGGFGLARSATADDSVATRTQTATGQATGSIGDGKARQADMNSNTRLVDTAPKGLGRIAGDWSGVITMWGQPGTSPTVATGTMTNRLSDDRRYIEQQWSGEYLGDPFTGFGMIGRTGGGIESTWIDPTSDTMSYSTGVADESMTRILLEGEESIGRTTIRYRDELLITGLNSHEYTRIEKRPSGDFKSMHIQYERLVPIEVRGGGAQETPTTEPASKTASGTAPSNTSEIGDTPMQQFICFLSPKKVGFPENATAADNAIVGEHFQRLVRDRDAGLVILAGKTQDDEHRGIVIFKAENEAAAQAWADNDPAVKAGLFSAQVHPYMVAVMGEDG